MTIMSPRIYLNPTDDEPHKSTAKVVQPKAAAQNPPNEEAACS